MIKRPSPELIERGIQEITDKFLHTQDTPEIRMHVRNIIQHYLEGVGAIKDPTAYVEINGERLYIWEPKYVDPDITDDTYRVILPNGGTRIVDKELYTAILQWRSGDYNG